MEYRILSAPRFSTAEMDVRMYDSSVGQRTLWGHLALHLVRDHGVTVEFRIARRAGQTEVSLRLHGEPGTGVRARIAQAEALLPPEFRWRRVRPDAEFDQASLRMARVVRRLEFVDLPVPTAALGRGEGRAPLFGGAPGPDAGRRRIPGLDSVPTELLTDRFCLPLPGPIDEFKPRQKNLFQEFQRHSQAVLSICLHPIDPAERARSQLLALAWKRFLDPFAQELVSAGFSSVANLRSAYDRFSLPAGYLAHVSIRAGGVDDDAVVGLANVAASSFGGVRAFQVRPPSRSVPGTALFDRDRDVPARWTPPQLAEQRRTVRAQLAEGEIRNPEEAWILDFILRVPHLFTLEEAEQLVRLPVADEEGLPGFDSEPIPPFTVPSLPFPPVSRRDGTTEPPPPDRFRVGMVRLPGAVLRGEENRFASHGWHSIDLVDLTKHALVVGSTGSGKTMTTLFMARELARLGVPFAVIEPVKTEYHQRLRGTIPKLRRLRFEGGPEGGQGKDFFPFDPLRVPAGISVVRHISYVKSCFEAAFPLEPVMALLLENALMEYYTAPVAEGGCGCEAFTRGGAQLGRIRQGKVFPGFATFRDYLLGAFLDRAFSAKPGTRGSQADEWRDIFRRRFLNLDASVIGESFRLADALYVRSARENGGVPDPERYDLMGPRLLKGPVVVELDAIPDAEQKALVMAFLMTYLFEYRQAEDLLARERGATIAPGLRHFLIVEEAHRLLSTQAGGAGRGGDMVGDGSRAKAVGLFVDMLAEIRAFGQGLAIVEQIPTKIVPEAVKNTNLKIMLRLTAHDDREYLGEAMNFTDAQKRFVTTLKVDKPRPAEKIDGQINFVVFEEGVEQPLLLSLPLLPPSAPGGEWLYDEIFQPGEG